MNFVKSSNRNRLDKGINCWTVREQGIPNPSSVSWGKTCQNNSTRLPHKDFDSGELTKNHVNEQRTGS
ncbi:hypothetical protein TNCV_2815051 [Trichonephila clavipes]|nr:hypothetical protein TNCV_2994761 [Trichonephila clavipes]GFV29306.1 hypothetical protein TNCV_2815051 [Trichonephila clavipes]